MTVKLLKLFCILSLLVSMPALAGNVFKGQDVYTQKCAMCHGQDGKGMMHGTPDFTLGQGNLLPNNQLANVIRTGKGVMPGFMGQLQDEQIADVIAYIKSLY